jgi:hypothetical protein
LVRYLSICEKEQEEGSAPKVARSKSKIKSDDSSSVAETDDYDSMNVVMNPLMGMKKNGSGKKKGGDQSAGGSRRESESGMEQVDL